LTILAICSLLACGGNPPAPVEDRNARSSSGSQTYTVQRGDTLYSIAFRYGLDFRKVAAANRIPAPYTIYPGQRLALREAAVPPPAAPAPAAPKSGSSSAAVRSGTGAIATSPPAPTEKPRPVTKASSSSVKKSTPDTGSKVSAWRWPADGPVIRGYSSTVHKGIDIGGKRGDAVQAVAPGKVVYAGTGIVGFGELLIVKHNEVYLSAYGHNDRLLVAEGDTVKAGQRIAEKGSSGTDRVKLHFEIRKEGKPIDPQRLLPRR
jgi:lipoprotein NlpD